MYVGIVYYMTSQPLEMFRFGMFLSACLLISFVAQSVGLVVGAAMNVQVSKLELILLNNNYITIILKSLFFVLERSVLSTSHVCTFLAVLWFLREL